MSVAIEDVEAISPHIVFADECLGEFRAEFESKVVCGEIVGVDVGVGRCGEWGRFEENDLVRGYEFCEVGDDVCL